MKRRTAVGFTLIELMVVILILAILAALVVPRVIGHTSEAKVSKAKSDIATYANALQMFRLKCDRYPTTDEGLQALVTPPSDLQNKWSGPYVEKIQKDPWGNDYHYTYPGAAGKDTFDIVSYGSDGQPGGDGDAADISSADL